MTRAGWYRLVIVVGLVALLEALCRTGIVPKATMIPPSLMAVALVGLVQKAPWFWTDVGFTFRNFAAAILMSAVGGFAGGLILHAMPRVRRVMDPLFSSYYSVPTFVFYPMLIVIFGIGPMALIVMGAMFGIVAMVVSTMTAMDRIPRAQIKTARVMRLDPVRTALLIKLPAAAPHLLTGFKLAVAYSVIGVIAGEFILATAGAGRRIALAYNDFNNNTMYGMLLLVLTTVMVANGLLHVWEKRLHARWYRR